MEVCVVTQKSALRGKKPGGGMNTIRQSVMLKVKLIQMEVTSLRLQMRRENQDVLGENCVIDNDGDFALDNKTKHMAWQQLYEKLLNT